MSAPFFLIGSERSGSTMCRLMLDSHPDIACNLESDFLVSQVGDDGQLPNVNAYRRFLRNDRIFRHSRFRIDAWQDYRGLVDSFLEQKRSRDNKRLVGATVHHDFHRLRHLWPEARYVYLLRDGRDVARSAVGMGWAGNSYCGADIWLKAEAQWRELRAGLQPSSYIEVRFEDLVRDPRTSLARICVFLGVEFSEEMLAYPSRSSYGAPDPRLVAQWHSAMPQRELRLLEGRLDEALRQRYYPLSDLPPLRPGPLGVWLLRQQSRILRLWARQRRYGLGLTVKEFLARRLGLHGLQTRLQQRFDALIDQGLK
jgi:hypothetical protein